MLGNPSVIARNVSRTFYINRQGFERGLNVFREVTPVEALKPISFVAYEGESIGIIGKNGSGKSTLLNILAGHEKPTTGEVFTSARPSLLSVGAALKQNVTGLENIRLGLLAKGVSHSELNALVSEVADWSEIGDGLNRPFHTYSSGMKARLQFAISTAVRPKILMIDEALATGDPTFNEKAQQRMNSFLEDASTVFTVSHSTSTIQRETQRTIWIDDGQVISIGNSHDVCTAYNRWSKALSERDRVGAGKALRRAMYDYRQDEIVLASEIKGARSNHAVNER